MLTFGVLVVAVGAVLMPRLRRARGHTKLRGARSVTGDDMELPTVGDSADDGADGDEEQEGDDGDDEHEGDDGEEHAAPVGSSNPFDKSAGARSAKYVANYDY